MAESKHKTAGNDRGTRHKHGIVRMAMALFAAVVTMVAMARLATLSPSATYKTV